MHRNTHSPAISSIKLLPFLSASLQNKNKLCHLQLQHIPVQSVFSLFCTQSLVTLFSPTPPGSHPLRLIAKAWQNTKAPDTKNLSKLLYTTLTYLGMAAEKCLGHLGSTTVALLPSGTCWRRSWGGASGAQAAPTAAHTEILGAAGHLKAPPPSTDSGTASHLRECCRGEDLCGTERKDWKNFSRGFSLSIRIHFMPTSWLEKCSLYHWEFFITGL